jgi:hypothetical protein
MEADGLDTKRWTPRSFSSRHRRLEEPRLDARPPPRSEDFAGGAGQALYASTRTGCAS